MNKLSFFGLFLFLVLFGCKSKYQGLSPELKPLDTKSLLEYNSHSFFCDSSLLLKKCSFTYETGGNVQTFNGSIFILKDSFIIISVQVLLGIEVARIKISPVEIVILDRFHKKAIYSQYQTFLNKNSINIDFFTFQALLLNMPFNLSKINSVNAFFSNFNVTNSAVGYELFQVPSKKFLWIDYDSLPSLQAFTVEPTYFNIIKALITQNDLNSSLSVNYDKFIPISSYRFPTLIVSHAVFKNISYSVTIQVGSLISNSSTGISFNIPSSYEKVVK